MEHESSEWGIEISLVNKGQKSVRVTKAGLLAPERPVFTKVGDFESPVPPDDRRDYKVPSDEYLGAANPFQPITGFVELFDRRRLASPPKVLIEQMTILEAVHRLGRPLAGGDLETNKVLLNLHARKVEEEWAAVSPLTWSR